MSSILLGLRNSLISVLAVFLVGILLDFVLAIIRAIVGGGSSIGNKFINVLTFPGVIHHELAHAIMALITGAELNEIKLFQNDPYSNALGYVIYTTRGNFIFQAIQTVFASCGPLLLGMTSLGLMSVYLKPLVAGNLIATIGYYYLFASIFFHASLSGQDIKSMKGKILIVIVLMTVICYLTKFDFFKFVLKFL